jgi:hypothetical protein
MAPKLLPLSSLTEVHMSIPPHPKTLPSRTGVASGIFRVVCSPFPPAPGKTFRLTAQGPSPFNPRHRASAITGYVGRTRNTRATPKAGARRQIAPGLVACAVQAEAHIRCPSSCRITPAGTAPSGLWFTLSLWLLTGGIVACDECRSRKSRCDGQRPTCQSCSFHKVPCIYEAPKPKANVTKEYAHKPRFPYTPHPKCKI